ncbi:LysR substrate-binding domain-containing protein [Marinobacter sp. AL4B]|uniref:LysR substrate-binding domain-containing protein n=1 Tax=Marinobacter sp. AL4B TaxID=2871173 RepID=UPI001CAA7643|nr:LysR substrate-binding domain-containing protein [Marinobacter sp. AL4B]MBZ0334786.1 LysR family transcriptional regulator [Marinobacter sp. AL4B]
MKKRLPPLNWLRTFEAAARHLNLTQAALELNLTQAAISQHVKGLESQLGTELFRRLPRGLELTDAGKAYLPVVHECIRRLATATNEIFGQGKTRLLTVRTNLVFFTAWIAPRFARFREMHPDVGVRFTSNIWLDNSTHDSDMEVRYGKGDWPGFDADRLSWDELFPVCSPQVASTLGDINSGELGAFESLSKQTLLHVIGYEEGWGHWLDESGLSNVQFAGEIQFDTLITAMKVAEHGDGIALGRTCLVEEAMNAGTLVAPFEQKVPTAEAFYLVRPANKYLHPHAEIFRSWLLEEAAKAR